MYKINIQDNMTAYELMYIIYYLLLPYQPDTTENPNVYMVNEEAYQNITKNCPSTHRHFQKI